MVRAGRGIESDQKRHRWFRGEGAVSGILGYNDLKYLILSLGVVDETNVVGERETG
jgi:hypothetical protein